MTQLNFHSTNPSIKPPPSGVLPVVAKIKNAYLLWVQYHQTLPKIYRHSLGQRIDITIVEAIESAVTAGFLSREQKLPFVRLSIRKIDTAKILLMVLWETKALDNKKYIVLSEKLVEAGKMLGGWSGQITKQAQQKQNSPNTKQGEK